mmetsp:Transcript_4387/g.16244  ORF Transcript_4387/g.16244 Transcript_4387/m.16244 type:complete len:215 (-) Transcript_4387:90-734(-)
MRETATRENSGGGGSLAASSSELVSVLSWTRVARLVALASASTLARSSEAVLSSRDIPSTSSRGESTKLAKLGDLDGTRLLKLKLSGGSRSALPLMLSGVSHAATPSSTLPGSQDARFRESLRSALGDRDGTRSLKLSKVSHSASATSTVPGIRLARFRKSRRSASETLTATSDSVTALAAATAAPPLTRSRLGEIFVVTTTSSSMAPHTASSI